MENDENEPLRTSNLRPPSRLQPTSGRSLYDITESTNNAPLLPVSTSNKLKHKPYGLPEPVAKRKTLAERAGELRTNPAAPPNTRPVNNSVKATTLTGVRNGSFSSSTSRAATVSSRNTSTSTHASSVAYGSRPAPANIGHRPQSAMSQIKGIFKPSESISRPVTSHGSHTSDEDNQGLGKRKGMTHISPTPVQRNKALQNRKQRGQDRRNDHIYIPWSSSIAYESQSRTHSQPHNPYRDLSITSGMQHLSIIDGRKPPDETSYHVSRDVKGPATPSYIPKPVTPSPFQSVRSLETPCRHLVKPLLSNPKTVHKFYLTRDSNTVAAWDMKGRLEDMEQLYGNLKGQMETTSSEKTTLKETLGIYKTRSMSEIRSSLHPLLANLESTSPRTLKLTHGLVSLVNELESIRSRLSETNSNLQNQVDELKRNFSEANLSLQESSRRHNLEVDDLQRKRRIELDDVRDDSRRDKERAKREAEEEVDRLLKAHQDGLAVLERRMRAELEDERSTRRREVEGFSLQLAVQRQNAELEVGNKDRDAQKIQENLSSVKLDLEREKIMTGSLKSKLAESSSNIVSLESSMQAMKAKINFLESDSQAQTQSFVDLNQRMQEAIDAAAEANEKLRKEETLRRKLHNQVQELKGNIRVFCRVRPTLPIEAEEAARISYPDNEADSKEVVVMGPEQKSALGNVTTATNNFSFDRVFGPLSQNSEVFDEISQLVQSALDGYNVCIFCYGQTGSGKTFTMSAEDGMIPLAVNQIYNTATSLEEKGWKYTMEGSFVEVYNEVLNDLLGKADDIDRKKHEIRHDGHTGKTTITDVTTIKLDSPSTVQLILKRATANRSVAATKANERSSRSHSVFILRLTGENSITGERSEGTLNLVDLAGSERVAHSGATGDRLKETQNINRSLSCLGDVISALGQGKNGAHIPYRNSKLTYLLQHSLGGNSKTLMFVMISPMMGHLSETLTSLKFATKVHNTHIGTAKRQAKARDA